MGGTDGPEVDRGHRHEPDDLGGFPPASWVILLIGSIVIGVLGFRLFVLLSG